MIKRFALIILKILFKEIYQKRYINQPVALKHYFFQKVLSVNRDCYWPVDWRSTVIGAEFILVGAGSAPGYSQGNYIVASLGSPITVGDYTVMGPNVILPGRNNNIYDHSIHDDGGISVGNFCWIGANAVILPNVTLGDHVVVGAGSVVTRSFQHGYVVIAGNPAKVIRHLDKGLCLEKRDKHEYHGYIRKENFSLFREKNLKV